VAWNPEGEEGESKDLTTQCSDYCGCTDDRGSALHRLLGGIVHRSEQETGGEGESGTGGGSGGTGGEGSPGEAPEGCDGADCSNFCKFTWPDYLFLQSKILCAKACKCDPYNDRRLGAAVHRSEQEIGEGEPSGGSGVVPADCDLDACVPFCTIEWLEYKSLAPPEEDEVTDGDRRARQRQVLAVDELWEDEDVEEWDEPELLDEPVRRQLPVELPQGGLAKRESRKHTSCTRMCVRVSTLIFPCFVCVLRQAATCRLCSGECFICRIERICTTPRIQTPNYSLCLSTCSLGLHVPNSSFVVRAPLMYSNGGPTGHLPHQVSTSSESDTHC
jgi:hypothetical protein